jgi:hypothetical protein
VKPDDVKSAATGKPTSRRNFFGLFCGSVKIVDTDATGSTQNCDFLFGCSPPKTFNQHAQFDTSSAYGVRIGKWLEDYPSIGLAMDISYLSADGLIQQIDGVVGRYNIMRFKPGDMLISVGH